MNYSVMILKKFRMLTVLTLILVWACGRDEGSNPNPPPVEKPEFYFGADLSYVNQILDHGGVFKDNNEVVDPYKLFSDKGTDIVRLRLWHNPVWTKEIYEPDGDQLYNDLNDVKEAIIRAKEYGMKVLLDFHYSDFWADPGRQEIPAAWLGVKNITDLQDSVYNYTHGVLTYLNDFDLMPEFVQIGNETNCGMLYEYNEVSVDGFPACNACNGGWGNLKKVIGSAISAINDVESNSPVDTRIILHVADPVNVEWWFDNLTNGVNAFDIIGISYYPIWHTGVQVDQLSNSIAQFKSAYGKDIMVMETAYPWTTEENDSYSNIFSAQTPTGGYPFTRAGQVAMLKKITQEVIDGGGIGVFYWEPAWITSSMQDFWNQGSSWENCSFFDYDGNANQGFDYISHEYNF